VVKYSLRVQNFFSASWHPGGTGPPDANLGPIDISETTIARKLNLKIPASDLQLQQKLHSIEFCINAETENGPNCNAAYVYFSDRLKSKRRISHSLWCYLYTRGYCFELRHSYCGFDCGFVPKSSYTSRRRVRLLCHMLQIFLLLIIIIIMYVCYHYVVNKDEYILILI